MNFDTIPGLLNICIKYPGPRISKVTTYRCIISVSSGLYELAAFAFIRSWTAFPGISVRAGEETEKTKKASIVTSKVSHAG